jgi:SAM-dependent methyltransferase
VCAMSHDTVALFEEEASWDAYEGNLFIEERTRIVLSMLPPGIRSVVDVGCGSGILVRSLREKVPAIGLDPSRRALALFAGPRICALGQNLPLRTASVDLICALEVLEHLDDDSLLACCEELARASARWILVATPDREDPRRNSIRCPRCGLLFNRSHHLQSFNQERLLRLFPGYSCVTVHRGGRPVRAYPYPLLWLRHRLARRYYKGPGETRSLCPRCGNREFSPFRPNALSVFLDGTNRILSRRRPYWVILLLERRQTAG